MTNELLSSRSLLLLPHFEYFFDNWTKEGQNGMYPFQLKINAYSGCLVFFTQIKLLFTAYPYSCISLQLLPNISKWLYFPNLEKIFFFLTDTGFWRNREQSSMAKAGRPYFKRYETKITDHNVRIRRFFVRDYNVINSSQLDWHYLFARYTCARKHFSRIGAFFYYCNHCCPIVSAYLTYCCYGRINGNVRRVKSNIYSVCQSSRLSVVMTERSSYLSRPFLIEEFSSKQISSFL